MKIVYIGQKGDGLADVPANDENIDEVFFIQAGKFRRYHGEGLKQIFDIPTLYKNIRDAARVVIGLFQSFWLLWRIRPDIIFVKGGFVGVPVGLNAALLHIPYITHDSDALPGLANRIIARWARKHAVGLPKEVYAYPADKTVTVGVPLMHHYRPLSSKELVSVRKQLALPKGGRVVLVTGGGLGAQRLNTAVAACAEELLNRYRDLVIVQIAGRNHEAVLRQRYRNELSAAHQKRMIVKGFITNLHQYSGVAEVVVTRAGATSIAEFAAQEKACVVIPNPLLTGGHQLKNAKVLADRNAIKLLSDEKITHDTHALMPPLIDLLDNPTAARRLGKRLGQFSEPDSAQRLAVLLLEEADKALAKQ